ncbi:MAG: response regulator [Pyrinomonadaceae bacterium]|jgi:two-component system CheB/CheR fusion protein|nr:response regulator [Pyrinomonadaceae bacterium]
MQGNYVSLVANQSILFNFPNQHLLAQANGLPRDPVFEHQSTNNLERRRHALVVDDVADVREMLSVLLTYGGYEVVTADSGFAAIDAARQHKFDVIISDICMPGMNGYDLARALRALPGYEKVPMVAVTGFSISDDCRRSLEAGFNAHLTKPIEPRAFLDLIEHL